MFVLPASLVMPFISQGSMASTNTAVLRDSEGAFKWGEIVGVPNCSVRCLQVPIAGVCYFFQEWKNPWSPISNVWRLSVFDFVFFFSQDGWKIRSPLVEFRTSKQLSKLVLIYCLYLSVFTTLVFPYPYPSAWVLDLGGLNTAYIYTCMDTCFYWQHYVSTTWLRRWDCIPLLLRIDRLEAVLLSAPVVIGEACLSFFSPTSFVFSPINVHSSLL